MNQSPAKKIEGLRLVHQWQKSLKNPNFICSSWAELCPWYKRGLGQLMLAKLWQQSLSLRQRLKIFATSLRNLAYCPRIHIKTPSTFNGPYDQVLLTWSINPDDNVARAFSRFYGEASLKQLGAERTLGIVFCSYHTSVQATESAVIRLLDDHAIVVYDQPASILENLQCVLRNILRLRKIALDGEYWRGIRTARAVTGVLHEKLAKNTVVHLPYEQQPWQLNLIFALRQKFGSGLKIVGDIHSSMTNHPAQWGRLKIGPDQLIVHGSAYARVLKDHLGWQCDEIRLEFSQRYGKKLSLDHDSIFLPYDFANADTLIRRFQQLLKHLPFLSRKTEIKLHPAQQNLPSHQHLYQEIKRILETTAPHPDTPRTPIAIVVGVSTTMLEALEAGYTTLGIYEAPDSESYSDQIWTEIESNELSTGIFQYKLLVHDAFIKYAKNNQDTKELSVVP